MLVYYVLNKNGADWYCSSNSSINLKIETKRNQLQHNQIKKADKLLDLNGN